MKPKPTVFVVDDDQTMRRSIAFLAESVGWTVAAFTSAAEFLASVTPDAHGCLILDVRMPGMSGIELQRELALRRIVLPIVFVTGHGDIAMAVQALKDGALDFIEKPFKDQQLLDAIARAMREALQQRRETEELEDVRRLIAQLTPREQEVATRAARGLSNKLIARELNISDKTVQVHRGHVMEKLGVHSAAELAQVLMRVPDEFLAHATGGERQR
jgi:FixJ family two-component response regulator